MINIIIQKIKEHFKGVVYYAIGLIAYAVMIVGLFPSISSVKFDYLQSMPENLIKFFGGDVLAMTTFNGFISMEFLSLFFILIIAFFIGSSAGSTIAGSIEKKTMDFHLSQPISRTKIVLAETITGLFYTAFLVFATSGSLYLFGKMFDVVISNKGLIVFSIVATIFLWAIYGIAIFISSVLKSKIAVAGATVSIVMAFYVFTAMTSIIEKLKDYDKFSIFYAYNPQELLGTAQISTHQVEALLLILVTGLIASLIIFNKKDI